MGVKVGSMYHVLKLTALKNQLNHDSIEESIQRKFEKKLNMYQKKNEILEEKLSELTIKFSEEDI
jgi:hypothetical protein